MTELDNTIKECCALAEEDGLNYLIPLLNAI